MKKVILIFLKATNTFEYGYFYYARMVIQDICKPVELKISVDSCFHGAED